MQTIKRILKTNGSIGTWSNAYGQLVETPIITIGMRCRFEIAIYRDEIDESGNLIPVAYEELQGVSFYTALDNDYIQETDPKLINLSGCSLERDSVTGGAVFIAEVPNTAVHSLLSHINHDKQISLDMEIGGFDEGEDVASFVFQMKLDVRNRIWLGNNPPEDVTDDPDYWNAAQIKAFLSQTPQVQTSANGENWDDEPDENDLFWRWRIGDDGRWTNPLPIFKGEDGRNFTPDQIGSLADRPVTPAENFCFLASDTGLAYWFISGAWSEGIPVGQDGQSAYELAVAAGFEETEAEYLESLKGSPGTNGKNGDSAYRLAVINGFAGTVEEWLESLKGEDGKNASYIIPNVTGTTLNERDAYGDKPAGFIFAAAVINEEEHYTDTYYYTKASNDLKNWSNPLIIRTFGGVDGKDGENAKLIPPLEFTAPSDSANGKVMTISTTAQKYPNAHISQICINTADGEYALPYNTAAGVEKIIRQSDGSIKIFFGTLVPAFETGKVYWSQAAYPENQFGDAPRDGKFYCRKNGQWVAVNVVALEDLSLSGTKEYNLTTTAGTLFELTFDAVASTGDAVAITLAEGSELPDWMALTGKTISGTPAEAETLELTFIASVGEESMEIILTLNITAQLVMYYGYVPYEVAGNIQSVSEITLAMLTDSNSSVTETDAAARDKTSLGNVPAGAWAVVMIPKASELEALKFDGVGGWTTWAENNGFAGSGANGEEVLLGDVPYLVYGQFNLATSELFFKTQG